MRAASVPQSPSGKTDAAGCPCMGNMGMSPKDADDLDDFVH